MSKIWARVLFAFKYKTLRRISLCEGEPNDVVVFHKGTVVKIKRRCPHQGGPLEKGSIQGDDLVCPWHGCRFSLTVSGPVRPYTPTLNPI